MVRHAACPADSGAKPSLRFIRVRTMMESNENSSDG